MSTVIVKVHIENSRVSAGRKQRACKHHKALMENGLSRTGRIAHSGCLLRNLGVKVAPGVEYEVECI